MTTTNPTVSAGVDGTLRTDLFRELETALDRPMADFASRQCRDAAERLTALIPRIDALRAELPSPAGDGDQTISSDGLRAFAQLLQDTLAVTTDLDFGHRLSGTLTDVEVIARGMGAVADRDGGKVSADDAEFEAGPEVADLTDLQSVARRFRGAVKDSVRGVVKTAVQRHAAVSSAATRVVHAVRHLHGPILGLTSGGENTPGAVASSPTNDGETAPPATDHPVSTVLRTLDDLDAALRSLSEWLSNGPLDRIRESVRELVRECAGDEPGKGSAQRGSIGTETIAEIREHWEREGKPDRIRIEAARLEFLGGIAGFGLFLKGFARSKLLAEADRVLEEAVEHLTRAVEGLRSLHVEAQATFERGDMHERTVGPFLQSGRSSIREAREALTRLSEHSRALDAATDCASSISDEVGRLADRVRIGSLVRTSDEVDVDDGGVTVEPREWAQDAFGTSVLERLRDCALPYAEGLRRALDLVPSAETVLEYNLAAAVDLTDEGAEVEHDLRQGLVLGGLDRTADRLAEAVRRLEEVRREAPLAAELVLSEATVDFWQRARAEASLEGRARDIWATLSHGAGRASEWAGKRGTRVRRSATALFRLGSTRALGTLRRARQAVGADPIASERVDATVRVIAEVDAVASDLPFVYRRLFSYRPISDESLLIGRDKELAAIDTQLERWRGGTPDAPLIVGATGVGVSSLIHVTRQRWADKVDWCSIELEDREIDEVAWARTIARTLGIEPEVGSLSELRTHLDERPEPPRPQVCVIDNFELLYRRGVLDCGLIDKMLRFMSATDASVLWIAPLAESAWQVLTALKPGVTAHARVLRIEALSRRDIEQAILARHQRSGIPLIFDAPADPPIAVRRALSNAKDEDARQAILRGVFFDHLFELSDGYVALALLYWLRSLTLEAETEVMHIRGPMPIDFGAWDDLESTGAFALRAFLEHGSLTIEEYQFVFGAGPELAISVFERLGNLLLIEATGPARSVGTRLRFRRVDPASRYRIRPVLVRPVERLLHARRLLY